ncbi:MAG: tetratricopeptide repeat protein [Clostridiales bacterium]|nr:tetratricopeptide repeat protein [Clostridiales bacterium]
MLHGVLRRKEYKIIVVILLLLISIMGIIAAKISKDNKRYKQQAVMAKQYLEEGNYEHAVEAYQKAMSMKGSDHEALSIGLAEAYVGIHQYDLALEVLRDCYQTTSSIMITKKIEEITIKKADYEYQQIISRGDIYFSNEEYDKAISEYENAKLIKSREVTSYQKIAESYIKMGKYDLAKEEVQEGLTITQSEELNQIEEIVDSYVQKQQYDSLIAKAEELIFQENYEDGIATYQEAIRLLPKEVQAYIGMANVFLIQGKYQIAVTLLKGAKEQIYSEELDAMLEKALQLHELEETRRKTLNELYYAVEEVDHTKISEIMNSEFFINEIADDVPVYYSPLGEGDISRGYGMIIFDNQKIYSGTIIQGVRKGSGTMLQLTESHGEHGFYYYQGEWGNDIPNGTGSTVEIATEMDDEGQKYRYKIVAEGSFYNGMENGFIEKSFYIDDEEIGSVSYYASNGVPMRANDDNGNPLENQDQKYPIGIITKKGVPTGDYYYVKPGTFWGVKPYV